MQYLKVVEQHMLAYGPNDTISMVKNEAIAVNTP
jgi:hypothetical protein